MDKKFIKKREKSIGMKKIRNQISAINALIVFLVIGGVATIAINHKGVWLSYSIIVLAVAAVIMALFIALRAGFKRRLNNMQLDYKEQIVKPLAELTFEDGYFMHKGTLTQREIINTYMFSNDTDYKYSACNELRGIYKGVRFLNADIYEDNAPNDIHQNGRLFELDITSPNTNPIVFTSTTAAVMLHDDDGFQTVVPQNEMINRMFRVYAHDEQAVNSFLTENMIYKIRQLVSLQLGKVLKICFMGDKTYVYFTTDNYSYPDKFTKRNDVKTELRKTQETFNVIGKMIDIL